ncbi:endonuclease/exonuclease/phosphatase family protein [Chitinophaga horti]|uniref:Endonuclease/exonuclease/phosphatase family protein n=1 Tax=Chitinophaga horti TaxID=2920382 RepID=A0ABY6J0A0_9BACT|nr:endonuclease/exonuclease/phosphatase family protein [Chitinophaga horti]UYQ93094.1 endonuclease/exonuclease/phosphatase family protein [Chitinophaga horti]
MPAFVRLIILACVLLLTGVSTYASIIVCTWNIRDFGQTRTDEQIRYIAQTIKHCDVVSIQEVVAGAGGAQAVAKLAEHLNRTGVRWDYVVSVSTSSSAYKRERYAFLWKTSRLTKIGAARLEKQYHLQIDREPFYIDLKYEKQIFTLAGFHAITAKQQPEREVKYLRYLPVTKGPYPLVFCGDFNLPSSHSVFNPFKKMGYLPVLTTQKTSLRQKCRGMDCLASAFDNIFIPHRQLNVLRSGVIHFYRDFPLFDQARGISDHIPVFAEIDFR